MSDLTSDLVLDLVLDLVPDLARTGSKTGPQESYILDIPVLRVFSWHQIIRDWAVQGLDRPA